MTQDTPDNSPQIQIDDDWKAQAQAEKERLAQQEQAAGDADAPKRGELPPADFKGLIGVLASQAVMGLGAMPDPQGRGVMIDLDGAKFAIDLLAMLEEKTAGNLDDEEAKELTGVLGELRDRFVQVTQLLAQQMTNPPAAGDAAAGTAPASGEGASKIIMPD